MYRSLKFKAGFVGLTCRPIPVYHKPMHRPKEQQFLHDVYPTSTTSFQKLYLSSSAKLNSFKVIKIGCGSGFWGDTPTASGQLIKQGDLDFIIYDYLSEITMSLLTAVQTKNPELGFASDFVLDAVGPFLKEIKSKGIRIISNGGGVNPVGCAGALKAISKKCGVELKVGVVTGDNLMPSKEYIGVPELSSGKPLPSTVQSMNAYLGSGPIVRCLDLGADIVVTGRCADSSLALAPMIHSFGWKWSDLDLLASGSLVGHLIECGAQATGGIFTDWQEVDSWDNIGFPIAEVSENGSFKITKPPGTGGLVTPATLSEQLLYEIGNPSAYILPDVVCDFTGVKFRQVENGVEATGAKGKAPTDTLKVCATYLDGFKATAVCCIGGPRSAEKGRRVAEAILKRSRKLFQLQGLNDFTRTHVQVLGSEQTYGPHGMGGDGPREGVLWMSVHHQDKKALDLFSKELASAGTGMAPGLTSVVGGRPKPSPLLRLHSFLVKKEKLKPQVSVGDDKEDFVPETQDLVDAENYFALPDQPCSQVPSNLKRGSNTYRLQTLAYARSGDKGDSCNIGVVARKAAYLPYIEEVLSRDAVVEYFAHLFPEGVDPKLCVKRYEVKGINALNFVLEECLGGGGIASLRSDPQGKALAQMLLDFSVPNMPDLTTFDS